MPPQAQENEDAECFRAMDRYEHRNAAVCPYGVKSSLEDLTRTWIANARWIDFSQGGSMLRWALGFFVVALIAAVFGFFGIAAAAAGVAKLLFLVFIILFLVSLVAGLVQRA
jgi:uncharacterized membrane protein YtjA (UPF0391 family)